MYLHGYEKRIFSDINKQVAQSKNEPTTVAKITAAATQESQ